MRTFRLMSLSGMFCLILLSPLLIVIDRASAQLRCCGTGMCRSGCSCSCLTVASGTLTDFTHASPGKGTLVLPGFPEPVEFYVSEKDSDVIQKLDSLKGQKGTNRFTFKLRPRLTKSGDLDRVEIQCVGVNEDGPDHTVELGTSLITPMWDQNKHDVTRLRGAAKKGQ